MRRAGVVMVGLTFGTLGCGSAKGTVDAGPDSGYALPSTPLSPLAACLQLATAEANFEVSCGRLASADVGDAASGFIGAHCSPPLYAKEEAAFQAGQLAYNGAVVSCLVNALTPPSAKISCNTGYPQLDPTCGQLAWGTLGPGAACDDAYACASGFFCQVLSGSACGTCVVDANLNQLCGVGASGAFCSAGICNGSQCRPLASANQGCSFGSAVCRLPLTCHEEGCQPPLGVDGGCNNDGDCANGLSCNAFSSHCLVSPGIGDDCSEQSCGQGLACRASDAGFTCAPLVAGGACVLTDGGPQCFEFEGCRDGGCVPLSQFDGGCDVTADCAVGACLEGICRLVADGMPCRQSIQCESGICDVSGSATCVPSCH